MNKIKSVLTAVLITLLICLTAFSVSGLSLQHVSTTGGFVNSIQAGFAERSKGTGDYSTKKGKILKQCYVRLKEGKYDSGRKYSAVGKKTSGNRYIWSKKLSKDNDLFSTCYTYYGWLYY